MAFSTVKISTKSTKAFKKKKFIGASGLGGGDIAESREREADPAGLEAPKVHCCEDRVLHRVGRKFLRGPPASGAH